jgi:hypothetical protein
MRALRWRWNFRWLISSCLTGQGSDPPGPPGGVLECPLGQVQVEGADRGQALAVADPLGGDDGFLPVRRGDDLRLGPLPLFPRVGDPAGQVEAADAGMVLLEVGPEPLREVVGEHLQAGVVHGGLAFPQVVHEQVADGAALQLVAVDELLRRELASGAEGPQPLGCLVPEDPHLAEHPVEDLVIPCRAGEALGLAVHQLQHVADGDISEHSALGRDDLGAAAQREAHGHAGNVRIGVA